MRDYFFSFRLSEKVTPAGTYDERYNALDAWIRSIANGHWLVPTSFGIVGSELTRAQFAAGVANVIDPNVDVFVLGMIDHKGITVIGNCGAAEISALQSMVTDLTFL